MTDKQQSAGTTGRTRLGNRLAPARFLAFLLLLPLAFLALRAQPGMQDWRDALAMGFDLAAVVFLVTLTPLLRDSNATAMRIHSSENDANRVLVLVFTSLLTLVVMAAISGELEAARHGDGLAMGKLMGTLLLIWLFVNSVYTLHYAHEYYASGKQDGDRGGIVFAGTTTPTYSDFAYFAFTVGMTFQTSDVAITSPSIRRITLLHGFAAFVFNIGVIAFTISALGGI